MGLLARMASVILVVTTTVVVAAPPASPNGTIGNVRIGDLATPGSLVTGSYHTCAIVDGGKVRCWGVNFSGQLGLGDTANRGDGQGEMGGNLPFVDLGTGRTATALAAGPYHTCALLDDATVKCWGSNSHGRLGLGDTATRGDGPGEMGDNLPAVQLGTGRTATAIAAGGRHTCAVLDDGAVKCWGRNLAGQLGLGDTASRGDGPGEMGDDLPAVDLGTGRTATAIAVGGNFDFGITFNPGLSHTCVLLDDGSVKCWGANGGRLGLGDTAIRGDGPGEMGDDLPTVDLGTGRTATAISAGWGHNCAVLDDGSVKCWGGNSYGQLGLGNTATRGGGPGEMGDNLPTVDLGTGRTATAVAAGESHTCALLDDRSVKCWGRSDLGQLGLGDTSSRGNQPGEMGDNLPTVDLGTGRTATAIATQGGWTTGDGDILVHDGAHTCARLDDGTIKCWGANGYGQLGLGNTTRHGDGPGEMGDRLSPADLGAGVLSVVLSTEEQRVWAGDPIAYLLTITNLGSTPLTGLSVAAADAPACEQPVPDLAVGEHHEIACSYLTSATAYGAYTNTVIVDAAQAGPVESSPASVHIERAQPRLTEALTTGSSHNCALLVDGAVKCWGYNNAGQLGLGDTAGRGDRPGQMGEDLPTVDLGTGRTATTISAGAAHTCALLDDHTVKCWGYNSTGQLGLGNKAARGDGPGEMGDNLPTVDLGTGRTATGISAGGAHTCAVLDDGSVKCWGQNGSGQLGLGTLRLYGDDGPGEMGDDLPRVDLGAGRTATAISAGDRHTCALLDDHTVKCWGESASGELGQGTTFDRGDGSGEMGDNLPPVILGTGRTATAISAGGRHTCAVLDDGSLKCWGQNDVAQLGQGHSATLGDNPNEMGDSLPPVNLGSGRTVVGATAAWQHSCAVLDNGALKCWGRNFNGQLGLGHTAQRGHSPGHMGDALPAVDVGSGRTTASSAGGESHTCALLDDRTIRCWGHGLSGKLGYGDTIARGDGPGEMGDSLFVVDLGATPAPGSVAGTVTESGSGNPLGGAFVAVVTTFDLGFVTGERAGPDGAYDLVVPAGAYYVFALDPGGIHTPGYAGSGTPDVIHVDAGASTVADPTLTPTRGQVTGSITDATDHSPVSNGLFVTVDGATGRPGRGAVTSGNGTFTVTHVTAGAHLGAFVDLDGAHTPEFHDDHTDPSTADRVDVSAGATANAIDAGLAPRTPPTGTARLVGTVTSSSGSTPLAGIAVIALRAADYQIAAGDLTDSDGEYDIGVDPGDHKLVFYDPSATHQMQWHANLAYDGIGQAVSVAASAAEPASTDTTLTPAVASISGRVRDSTSNTPIADAWVVAINAAGVVTAATATNSTGHYTLAYLPSGTYRLRVVDPTKAHEAGYYDHTDSYGTATPLSVVAGQNLTDRNTTLDPAT